VDVRFGDGHFAIYLTSRGGARVDSVDSAASPSAPRRFTVYLPAKSDEVLRLVDALPSICGSMMLREGDAFPALGTVALTFSLMSGRTRQAALPLHGNELLTGLVRECHAVSHAQLAEAVRYYVLAQEHDARKKAARASYCYRECLERLAEWHGYAVLRRGDSEVEPEYLGIEDVLPPHGIDESEDDRSAFRTVAHEALAKVVKLEVSRKGEVTEGIVEFTDSLLRLPRRLEPDALLELREGPTR
jgi:hypothetical protein